MPRYWLRICCSPPLIPPWGADTRHGEVVLADTVGFVSLLPHTLVEAFKATLEEVIYSDLLLHVVDASDPLWRERMEQVQQVLEEIGAAQLRQLVVLNKADLLDEEQQQALKGFGCLTSAQHNQGLEAFGTDW